MDSLQRSTLLYFDQFLLGLPGCTKEQTLGKLTCFGKMCQVSSELHQHLSKHQFLEQFFHDISCQNLLLRELPDRNAEDWNWNTFLAKRFQVLANWVHDTPARSFINIAGCALMRAFPKGEGVEVRSYDPKGLLCGTFPLDPTHEEKFEMKANLLKFANLPLPSVECQGYLASCGDWNAIVGNDNTVNLLGPEEFALNIRLPETLKVKQIELHKDWLYIRSYCTKLRQQILMLCHNSIFSKIETGEDAGKKNEHATQKIKLPAETAWFYFSEDHIVFVEEVKKEEESGFKLSAVALAELTGNDTIASPLHWKLSPLMPQPPHITLTDKGLLSVRLQDEGRLLISTINISSENIELQELASPCYQEDEKALTQLWTMAYHCNKVFLYGFFGKGPSLISYDLESARFSQLYTPSVNGAILTKALLHFGYNGPVPGFVPQILSLDKVEKIFLYFTTLAIQQSPEQNAAYLIPQIGQFVLDYRVKHLQEENSLDLKSEFKSFELNGRPAL